MWLLGRGNASLYQRPHGSSPRRGTRLLPRGGTFLEIGANNGDASNTRFMESCLGWRGLLIEGHPKNLRWLNKTRPNMLRLESAVCERHGTTNFSKRGGATSGIQALMSEGFRRRWRQAPGPDNTIEVPCG